MSVFDGIKNWLIKNGPTFLSAGAAIGTCTTAVFAGQAALEAQKVIEECEKDGHEMTKKEYIQKVLPVYKKALISGGLTELCIFGSWKANEEIKAGLTGANLLISTAFAKYRSKIDPEVDCKVMQEVRDEMEELDDKKRVWYIDFLPHPFMATKEQVQESFLYVNEMIASRGQCSIDDYCEFMDIPKIKGPEDENGYPEFGPGYLYGWGRESLELYQGHCFVKFTIDAEPIQDDGGPEINFVYVDIKPEFYFDMPYATYGFMNAVKGGSPK